MPSLTPPKPFTSRNAVSRRQLLGLALSGSLFLACSALSNNAFAGDKFVSQCHTPTPSITTMGHPGTKKIILSNNLARPTGKAENAPGQLLTVSGRVTDENCVPVINALIDIWQANPFGAYRYAAQDELLTPEPVFAGTGRTVTDNMGNFQFVTLFPGGYGRNAPHISLRVSHPDFSTIDSAMYFRGDRRNSSDPRLRALSQSSQDLLMSDVTMRDINYPAAGLQSTYNIVLRGKTHYRNY